MNGEAAVAWYRQSVEDVQSRLEAAPDGLTDAEAASIGGPRWDGLRHARGHEEHDQAGAGDPAFPPVASRVDFVPVTAGSGHLRTAPARTHAGGSAMANKIALILGIGFLLVGLAGFVAPALLGLHLSAAR
ncbi:MAG TPA: hypothetical protein VNA04_15150 [Thermoanaerobaculia bacterium]|nr:hypothetical protein [Thermoanaerobaculia bacterium]